jgi:hypothetical protein
LILIAFSNCFPATLFAAQRITDEL